MNPPAKERFRRDVQIRIATRVVAEDCSIRREAEVQVGHGPENRLQLGRGLTETLLRPLPLDGPGDLLRHEVEDRLVLFSEPDTFRVTLDDDHADRLAEAPERRPNPVHGRRSDQFDLARAHELLEHRPGGEEGASTAEDVFGEAMAK